MSAADVTLTLRCTAEMMRATTTRTTYDRLSCEQFGKMSTLLSIVRFRGTFVAKLRVSWMPFVDAGGLIGAVRFWTTRLGGRVKLVGKVMPPLQSPEQVRVAPLLVHVPT